MSVTELQLSVSDFAFGKMWEGSRTHTHSDFNLFLSCQRRGFLEGDEYSGWLVLDIDSIKEGIIIIKIDPWLVPSDDPIPSDWISPEENSRTRNLRTSYNIRDQDEGMLFEYAINGNVTTVPWKEFQPQLRQLQRTVYLFTVLDEPGFQGENVEVAFRTRNCGRRCRYGISHLYYA